MCLCDGVGSENDGEEDESERLAGWMLEKRNGLSHVITLTDCSCKEEFVS